VSVDTYITLKSTGVRGQRGQVCVCVRVCIVSTPPPPTPRGRPCAATATFASAVHRLRVRARLARIPRGLQVSEAAILFLRRPGPHPARLHGPRTPRLRRRCQPTARAARPAPTSPCPPRRPAAWATPFLGADASVVRRTMRLLYGPGSAAATGPEEVPLQFSVSATSGLDVGRAVGACAFALGSPHCCTPSRSRPLQVPLLTAASHAPRGGAGGGASCCGAPVRGAREDRHPCYTQTCTRLLLQGSSRTALFSHAGPSRADIAATSFQVAFQVRGGPISAPLCKTHALPPSVRSPPTAARQPPQPSPPAHSQRKGSKSSRPPPDASFLATVSGPEPGYDATSRIVAACALTLLRDRAGLRIPAGAPRSGAPETPRYGTPAHPTPQASSRRGQPSGGRTSCRCAWGGPRGAHATGPHPTPPPPLAVQRLEREGLRFSLLSLDRATAAGAAGQRRRRSRPHQRCELARRMSVRVESGDEVGML